MKFEGTGWWVRMDNWKLKSMNHWFKCAKDHNSREKKNKKFKFPLPMNQTTNYERLLQQTTRRIQGTKSAGVL